VLRGKFSMKMLSNLPPHLSYVAALPCDSHCTVGTVRIKLVCGCFSAALDVKRLQRIQLDISGVWFRLVF